MGSRVPVAVVAKWQALLKQYLAGRPTLRRAFALIDSRHGVKDVDHEIMKLLDRSAVPFQVVLTKTDKIGKQALDAVVEQVGEALQKHPAAYPELVVTSSEKGRGIATLRAPIDAFFDAVQINTDNQVLRRNRLNLLHRIRETGRRIADFGRIEDMLARVRGRIDTVEIGRASCRERV